jgi:hypothetical protein
LELSAVLKDVLINAGFSTIKSILEFTPSDISSRVGVDLRVAHKIYEAKRVRSELIYVPPLLDSNAAASVVAVKKEKFH